MLRSFAMDRPPLQVLSERENIYKLLSATSVDNLRKNYDAYTINPFTRYVNLNLKRVKEVYHLYDADDPVNADFRVGSPTGVSSLLGLLLFLYWEFGFEESFKASLHGRFCLRLSLPRVCD